MTWQMSRKADFAALEEPSRQERSLCRFTSVRFETLAGRKRFRLGKGIRVYIVYSGSSYNLENVEF